MILQALYEYYQRKGEEGGMPPEGFQWQEIPFVIVLDRHGKLVCIEDTREGEGKKRRPKQFLVPAAEKKSVNIKANLLWGNVEYALGANPRGRNDIPERHADFRRRLDSEIASHSDRDALIRFLDSDPLKQIERSTSDAEKWKEVLETNANVVFKVDGSEDSTICDSLAANIKNPGNHAADGICLVSGGSVVISRIHPSIKGVRDAQPAGAALVSFNLPAFQSYGKEQNYNAPVGESATFAYTTALNMLLRSDTNRILVGDASTVFWADHQNGFEDDFQWLWNAPPKEDPDRGVKAIENLYRSPYTGADAAEGRDRFFVLGLSPNIARVSVRFWHTGPVSEIAGKIRQHFTDLEIIKPKHDRGNYALFFLLADVALENKIENVPPNLAGDVMRSILTGGSYPATLFQQTIRRIRAQQAKQEIKRTQAAILKAYLNRQHRFQRDPSEKEITVALDPVNTNPGYRLGRLFAVLEKIQEESSPGLNATIRDRYFGSASANPMVAFPILNRLSKHHLAKLENRGRAVNFERLTGEIVDGLDAMKPFPASLNLADQGRFFVGYYHQRQAFFTKSDRAE